MSHNSLLGNSMTIFWHHSLPRNVMTVSSVCQPYTSRLSVNRLCAPFYSPLKSVPRNPFTWCWLVRKGTSRSLDFTNYKISFSNTDWTQHVCSIPTCPWHLLREPQNLLKPIAVHSAGKGADSTNSSWLAGSDMILLIQVILHRMCTHHWELHAL